MKQLLICLALAACAKAPDVAQPGAVPGLLRNPTAPLASQTDVTAARLKGDWYVREERGLRSLLGDEITISDGGADSLVLMSDTGACSDQTNLCSTYTQRIALIPVGPGRWQVVQASDGFPLDELWVLWMDFDDRTVAVGGPTGKYVWIMDRGRSGGTDRITAARDILDWYGYDVDRLEGAL
ncbi:apolipoprotein D and lipocalin family protein [Cognatiyoonia koreensis]|uniref:Apolipoprotein D and lipocalin family protein n=1 Tax=Cognatiyoonia koreensis TaxID=364200 RepID=A0A1I0QF15_9RHOB|nr:lipocalin family protein [Cognatiyoonia koreensis]SEW25549.1 apolipoprotein D and lipocalin family protein [Cognatiyoonia koreensis]